MSAEVYEFGPFRFEARGRRLLRDGHPIELTPRSGLLLLVLLEGGGDVVTRDELDRRVWGDAHVGLGSLPFQIHQLRRALGEIPDGQRVVETAPRKGYRIALQVRTVDEPAIPLAEGAPHGSTTSHPLPPSQPPSHELRLSWGLIAAAIVAIASAATAAMWRPPSLPRVTGVTAITRDGRAKSGPLRIGDGQVLYQIPSNLQLVTVPVRGGEPTPVPGIGGDRKVLDFSAVRREYLVAHVRPEAVKFDLWIVPASTGIPRRVGEHKCDEANWSPAGERIACTMDDTLSVFNSDGSESHVVARLAGHRPTWPRWSPDGNRIAFTVEQRRNRVVTNTIWDVPANGAGARELVAEWPEHRSRCCASWSPDGRYLAFVSHEANRDDLWLVSTGSMGGSGTDAPVRLTNGPLQLTSPAWLPDGHRIVALGVARGGEMVRYDARLHEFVPYLGGLSATWLSFSQDGRWIAYSSFPDNALWRARADGSDRQALTAPMGVQESSWSPDGAQIAFRTEIGSETPRLYVVARDGGTLRGVPSPSASAGMPTWSPDGQHLLSSDVPGTFGVPDGTERVRLYDLKTSQWSMIPGSEGLWRARWSPDGRYIAALTIRNGQQLRLYDTRRGLWLAVAANHINAPNWSRDGQYIYYDTEGDGYSLRRVGVPNGPVEELTSLSTFSRAAYWWSGLSLEGDPILLRNIGALELYTLDLDGL